MGRKSEFSRAEKVAAVQLTTSGGRTILSVASEYGAHENTIMKWKRQYNASPDLAFTGQNGETPPDETERLKRRIRQLENELEFLKKSVGILCEAPAAKYAVIREHAGKLRLSQACRTMNVRRQGYYE